MALTAAMFERRQPPIIPKAPPANTEVPEEQESVLTSPVASGSQEVASAVVVSRAATWLRVWPPTVVNAPPAYTVSPERAKALTDPSTSGSQSVVPLLLRAAR